MQLGRPSPHASFAETGRYFYPQITEISMSCVGLKAQSSKVQKLVPSVSQSLTDLLYNFPYHWLLFHRTERGGLFTKNQMDMSWCWSLVRNGFRKQVWHEWVVHNVLTAATNKGLTAHCPACTSLMDSSVWCCSALSSREGTASHTHKTGNFISAYLSSMYL